MPNHSQPLSSKFGTTEINIGGTKISCQSGKVFVVGPNAPKLDKDNPRLYHCGTTTVKQAEKALNEESKIEELANAIEQNGGLVEPIFICDGKIVEGNRRFAAYKRLLKEDKKEFHEIPVIVLPDGTSQDVIDQLTTIKHVAPKEPWESVDRSHHMWKLHNEHGKSIKDIARMCAMKPADVQNYIKAYELYETCRASFSDLDVNHWSKCHHASKSRACRRAFGFDEKHIDDAEPKFPEEFETKDGINGNIRWFAHLLYENQQNSETGLRDCRHVEEALTPLLKQNDLKGLKLIEKNSTNAVSYVKDKRNSNSIAHKAEKLEQEIKDLAKSSKSINKIRSDEMSLEETINQLSCLQTAISKLVNQLKVA